IYGPRLSRQPGFGVQGKIPRSRSREHGQAGDSGSRGGRGCSRAGPHDAQELPAIDRLHLSASSVSVRVAQVRERAQVVSVCIDEIFLYEAVGDKTELSVDDVVCQLAPVEKACGTRVVVRQ